VTAFLWIEDFPEGDPHATVSNVFGAVLGQEAVKSLSSVPRQIARNLERFDIHLQLTYANALRFINDPDELEKIDFIILDIDLKPYDEVVKDFDEILSTVRRWYNFKCNDRPGQPGFDEKGYQVACDELKRVAGYHLWAKLIIDIGFPRERILFCSDHGGNLTSITDAFNAAKLEIPEIPTKSDERTKESVLAMQQDAYVSLRRNVIEACGALQRSLSKGEIRFRLPDMPGKGAGLLDKVAADELLSILPKMLPFRSQSANARKRALRQFIVTLSQYWDRVEPGQMLEDNRTARSSGNPQKWEPWLCAYSNVLKYIRNWTSHSTVALTEVTEIDAAFVFLLGVRAMFNLGNLPTRFEEKLLISLGGVEFDKESLDIDGLLRSMGKSFNELEQLTERHQDLVISVFPKMLRELQKKNEPAVEDRRMGRVHQLFWHSLYRSPMDFVNATPSSDRMSVMMEGKGPVFVTKLAKATYAAGSY